MTFEALSKEQPPFPLADECLLQLAECHVRLERKQEAVATLQKLLKEFPDSPIAPEAEKKLRQLMK